MSRWERRESAEHVRDRDEFAALSDRPIASRASTGRVGAAIAYLDGFDLADRPLISGLEDLPGEVVSARAGVSLLQAHVGSAVVVVFENGDPRRPIVVGVMPPRTADVSRDVALTATLDDERLVLTAEREIVLTCGDASITLTRAGKVIIQGKYVVSRSSGHNRIKGAVVDIN